MNNDAILAFSDLSCERSHRSLYSNLSNELYPGDVLLIEGANGSGKSTLLRMLCGLMTPTSGFVRWQVDASFHYIGHSNGIKLGLTVNENLWLAKSLLEDRSRGLLRRCTPRNDESNVYRDDILSLLNLKQHQHTFAKQLSAGQKRKLALARLFLFPKQVWILDEPLTALDSGTQSIFLNQLRAHLSNGGIAVISSHQEINLEIDPGQTPTAFSGVTRYNAAGLSDVTRYDAAALSGTTRATPHIKTLRLST